MLIPSAVVDRLALVISSVITDLKKKQSYLLALFLPLKLCVVDKCPLFYIFSTPPHDRTNVRSRVFATRYGTHGRQMNPKGTSHSPP